MTPDELIDRLSDDFRDDFREQIKFVKLCHKVDLDGDDDGLLWHFTRFTIFQKMLAGREIWLSDLAYSNDENEVVYGLTRVNSTLNEITRRWSNRRIAERVHELAKRVERRAKDQFHIYTFSLSTERDTVQHWNGYGGGLNVRPDPNDPYVAVGFDAKALFYPLQLSPEEPPIYMINTVSGDIAADSSARYWAIKTRKALEVLEARPELAAADRVYELFEHMLVLACSLVKNSGWEAENEYRLLYITNDYGDEHTWLLERPDGRGHYVSLKWTAEQSPIRALVAHPLASGAFVETSLRASPGGSDVIVHQSELKPRSK